METPESNIPSETKNNNDLINYKPLLECTELDEDSKSGKEFEKINKKILDLLNKDFDIPLNINKSNIKSKNFIFTDNAIKKLKEIKYYLSHNYPVLLEGPTGTAKTKSVEILCEEMGLKLKRFNLSSETKTADLFGRYAGDPKSFSGLSFQEGIFIEAFKNGHTLLLDEINLASNQVLQSFEECLDSHKISCEIPGMPWQEIQMGKGFNLIATQNPNKGLFANKRQDLGKKFLSRFHIINFDSFQKEELYLIAEGLGDKYNIPKNVVRNLVDFHDEWSNLEERKNDILCFTVREIEATINAIAKGENIKDAILCIYGARYKSKEYQKLKSIFQKYFEPKPKSENNKKRKNKPTTNNLSLVNNNELLFNDKKLSFDNEFIYISPLLENVLKAIQMSFNNNRHVMIVGDEGTGKSYIAKFIAGYRDKHNDINYINDDGIYYCECTEELKCSDLIGNQYPSLNSSKDNSQELMKWEDGFLTLSIINGKCCVLDNIEEAPATITERLNGLLDKKLDVESDLIFEIPECPQKNEVKINKNFRLLCVCNYNNISKMSPAFLNRFDIITLEDQIKFIANLNNADTIFKELINMIIKQHSFNYLSNKSQNKENQEKIINNTNMNIKFSKFLNLSVVGDKIEKKQFEFNYEKNENLNKLIYNKVLNNILNDDLSIYKLSIFCKAVYIFSQELTSDKKITLDKIINYAYNLIFSSNIEDNFEIEELIYNKYLNYQSDVSTDNKYFFQESPKLKSFMAKLLALSMINLHVCVVGRTGVGKTSCAREFSRIRKKSMLLSGDFFMHSFHSNTKPSHFYGNITMKNNKIEFINGSLINAMEKGTTFIADEMNLSPDTVMKSLVPALDFNINCKIFIPGIKKKIKISQKFFFIACQNDFTTAGRNSLPKLLAKKLKCIPYPEPPIEDIKKICSNINLELYTKYDEKRKKKLIKKGESIAVYMEEINKLKLSCIPNWSIRDVTKVLKRVQYQKMEINKYKYDNIKFIDNIIFYTLSGIYKKDLKDKATKDNLINKIFNILKIAFPSKKINIKNIESIFNEEAKIVKGNEIFLRKGKCGISLRYIQFFSKNKSIFGLPSLYNDLFLILLAHDEEPILLIGESGYKTYLAQLLFPDIKPIQLNAETTIGQLLGSTIFLSDSEVKVFYLKQIYNILDIPLIDKEIKMVQNWINYNESNSKKILEEQDNLIKKIDEQIAHKTAILQKFNLTLKILKQKLISKKNVNKKNLNNINLEFKPGLILNSILSGKSLILKYLSNLPTVVLERFNELFSGKHNLTLNEDVHDTFTKEGHKEFSSLGENFRIFATCSLGEQNKLSEAVLSRFTIICTDKYKLEEQKDVLKSFLLDNKLDFNPQCIDEVIQFSKNTKNYSLSQMINALSLSNQNEIFKEKENISRVNILSFILYRINYGLSYKIKVNPDSQYYDIENKLQLYLPKFKGIRITGDDINEEPLILKKINSSIFCESKYNKLDIECGTGVKINYDNINNLAFTKTFTEMVDYIHLGIATNTPVILEGGTGLGKQTAIKYVAYKLNYRIINFIITQSTKIEDLLGRNQIIRKNGQIKIEFCETKILKVLIGKEGGEKNGDNNIIIVFHNLNKASSALMESLCSIFNKKQLNILRPDGKSEAKSKINLIGIINSQSNIAIKDKLPLSLINCVFYYILPKLSAKEIRDIILKKFNSFNLLDEAQEFANCFNKSREFSYTKGNISYFSLNDITKYILFRKYTRNSLDKSIILQILFAYRFIQSEFIKDIINELGFLTMKMSPIIKTKDNYLSIGFKNKEVKNEIKLPYYGKINNNEILKKINTLNIKQKQCILFLALSILCKRACVIQGDTASGKTYLIRLFAEMLGQKLIVYQINKETGLSIFTGQSILLNHLEPEEISTIIKYFEILSEKEYLQTYINETFSFKNFNNDNNENQWSVTQLNTLIEKIREYTNIINKNMKQEEREKFQNIANDLEDLIQPYKRFKKNSSMFIEALDKGYWVLIDGIESANPVISDKLIGLCEENAELDLTETGGNIIFSDNPMNKKIHPNFHLFINYNPLNKSNTNQLNEIFLNKCITFTLSPMDVDIESSAQIIYGFMKNSNNINELLCQDISSKVAIIHQEMNKKIHENQDFFSGGVEFTGRIIKFISEELSKSKDENDLCEHLINAFYLNYINSINNKNDKNNIRKVKDIIKNNLRKSFSFDTGEKDIYLKYSEIFKILINIQKITKNIITDYDFNFIDFLKLIRKVELNDLKIILYYINETLKLLDKFVGDSIKEKIKYFKYFNLKIIKRLLSNIINYIDNNTNYNILDFTLNDEEELNDKSILVKEISQFNLVYNLEYQFKKNKLTENFIVLLKEVFEYIDSINKLLRNYDIKDLYDNLKIIHKAVNNEVNLTQLFPFNQIILEHNMKKIRVFKIISLIYKIIENKFDMEFIYDSDVLKFNFKKDEGDSFKNLKIKIKISNDFYFEFGQLLINKEEEEKSILKIDSNEFDANDDEEIINNWFYKICSKILDHKIPIDINKFEEIMESVTNLNQKISAEITDDFEMEIKEDKKSYRITKLVSNPKEDLDKRDDNLIMKIWFLILFYSEDELDFITPYFCLPFEKELLDGMKNLYKKIDKNFVYKIIMLTKKFLELKNGNDGISYGNSNSFLYKIQAGFFNYSTIDNKDKKEYCLQILNEIKYYNKLNSPFENFWSKEKSIFCLNSQYLNLKQYIEYADQAEKYKNKLNELIDKVNNFEFEENDKNKEKLIRLLQSKLNNPTKEVYETWQKNINNYLNNLKEKLSTNQILFPNDKINDFNRNDINVICLDILKTYSKQHKQLTNIFKKTKNILSDIFQLDKEIEIISDILCKYTLENEEYIQLYKYKVFGIIRALILYKIIKIGKNKEGIQLLFNSFLNLSELINNHIGGNGNKYFNENILNWAKTLTTDLEDYFIIPKFEPKDYLYLFLIVYNEEKENGQITIPSKGFLFKNSNNEKISSLFYLTLKKYDEQDFENNTFTNFIEKIGRSLIKMAYSQNWEESFEHLTFVNFIAKLEEEKEILKNNINELKKNNKPCDSEQFNKEIIGAILHCFTLATIQEQNLSQKILKYGDLKFFTDINWNNELMSSYPGMTYWLSKYFPFYMDLMEKKKVNGCFIAKDNQISFWFFQIRVISNIQAFEYNCYNKKNVEIICNLVNVGKELENDEIKDSPKYMIEKYIKEKITNLINNNKPVNVNWLNLVLNEIPPNLKINHQNLRHFYEFFAILFADTNKAEKDFKNQAIVIYIKKLFDLIFDDKVEELFNKDINTDSEFFNFINRPKDEVINKIKELKQKSILQNDIQKNSKNTINMLNQIKKDSPIIIDKINNIVIEKTKEYHDIYNKNKEILLAKELKNIEKIEEQSKKDVIDSLSIIKSKDLQNQVVLINNIKKLNSSLKNINLISKREIIFYELAIKVELKKQSTYILQIKNKINKKNEKIEFNNNYKSIYLQSSIFEKNDIENFNIFVKDDYTKKLNIKNKVVKEMYSMNIPSIPICFKKEIKEKMIQNAKDNINIFESKITFNGEKFKREKLDNLIKSVNGFNEKSLDRIKLYDEKFRKKLINFINVFDDITQYLNLQTSNGKENDSELEKNVKDLRNLTEKCKHYLNSNLDDVNKVIILNKKIEEEKIFSLEHDQHLVLHEEPKKEMQIYISNLSYLNYPMISNNGKNITFSSLSFQMFLGSFIPSILSSPIIVKLLNIKGNKLTAKIIDSDKSIVSVDEIDIENTLKIYLNIQNLKPDKMYKENIQFKLEISSKNYNKLLIPFNLSLNIVPLAILFSLSDYQLIYDPEKKEFNFNSSIVYAYSKIKFGFKYQYTSKISNQFKNGRVNFDYSLDSLEKNNSEKPEIKKEGNKLILEIPKYEETKNNIINFILKIYFSSTFYINIKFNSKIFPFNFELKCYSYDKKKFTSDDIFIYIEEKRIPYIYTLYFKIENAPIKAEYEPIIKELDGIRVKEFSPDTDDQFHIDLKIEKKPSGYFKDFYIGLTMNKIEKKINIYPKIINKKVNRLKDLLDFHKYKYNESLNTFNEEKELEKESIYITPFNCYIPLAYNLYPQKGSCNSEPIYESNYEFCLLCFSEELSKFIKIEYKSRNNYKDITEIIGIFKEDKWYPIKIMKDFENDVFKSFQHLEFKEEEIDKAKEILKKINKNNDYWHLPTILKNYTNKKDILIQLLDYLPNSIKNELSEESNILNGDIDQNNLIDKYFPIILNNFIFVLYNHFKNKYLEIKKNNSILYLENVKPPSNISDIIEKKREEYFIINKNEILKIKDNDILKEKEKDDKKDGYNKYLLQENKNPINIEKEEPISLDNEKEKIELIQAESKEFDLSNISLLELNHPLINSINEIIKYYNDCTKIINILYFYIIGSSKSNNTERQLIAGNYYQKLYSIAKELNNKRKNYSFFYIDINEFLNGFKSLNEKLEKIGYSIGGKSKSNGKKDDISFIIWPKEKVINKDKDKWVTEQNSDINQFKQEEFKIGKIKANKLKNEEYFADNIDSEEENEIITNLNNEENTKLIDQNVDVDIEKIKIIDIDDNKFDDIYNEDEDNNIKSGDDNIKKGSENKIKVGKISDNLISINPIKVEENNFKEEDGIERAILLLKEEKKIQKKQQILDLGNTKKCHKFKNKNLFDIGMNAKLNIQQLYNKASFFANQLFIKINGNGKVKYSETLVILLIDPSVYISEQIKALNMFIICAMTNALNCLEIKYSIFLMGDEDFRCELKSYDEPHSIEALERVYECLMLKRFRTNIPSCLRYCLEEICPKSNFKYNSFFIFTDGLDKRFIYTQKNTWDTNIFYKKTNSFGFIFLLSSILKINDKDFLKQIWNKFINDTKNNSHSGIFLKSLELRIDQKFKDSISEIFILNLLRQKSDEVKNEIKYNKPIFTIKYDNLIYDFLNNINKVLDDKSLFSLNGTYLKNEIIPSSLNTNIEPLDTNCFKNNLHQMAKKLKNNIDESENNVINFAHKFLSIRTNLNRGILEEIFKPNKANLKVLSNTGTEIDINELILFFLNPVPDPMIYLQDAIGNIKEYAITIIIDTSFSVLNHLNINHSLNTIRVLLSSFTILDLPSFDLIVTGEDGPIILCSEYPTFAALNEKSKLWELLLHCLANPISNADLLSALQTAFDLKRMRTNNFPSYLFVLTDGLFEEDKQEQLKEMIAKLIQTNIHVIGIGLGVYPYGINNIFGQALFDINPNNLFNSILNILEGNINDINEMNYIQLEEENEKKILSTISELIQNKKYNFKLLREELKNSPLTTNCYDMLTDEKICGYDEQGRPINPKGDKIGLLKENSLLGQKILIVMLWSCELSAVEDKKLHPRNVEQKSSSNTRCIADTVDYLGVKVKTVLNYVDAINEITKKDKNEKCNYYTVWVLCGPDINQLPDKSSYPGLVEQFIDCLILYWQNGGAVALFCDNDPLHFQANMFLEKVRFKGRKQKTKLRILGNDPGKNVLRGYNANGNLIYSSIYDTCTYKLPNGTERMPIGRNVPQIYEGDTISHASSNNIYDIEPFIPFAKNSSGNICMMLYCTQGTEGDIFIDCGYTKLFDKMSTEDIATWRYVQNIAGFLARPEAHLIYDDGETAKNYRPNGINFNINYSNLYRNLQNYYGYLRKSQTTFSILILDVSGSMSSYYSRLIDLANEIIDNQKQNPKNEGVVIFFGTHAKTIINKYYRTLNENDIEDSNVGGGTNFYKGFNEASNFLEYGRKFESRRVLFLTDGEDDEYSKIRSICDRMKQLKYKINIIGFGDGSLFQNLREFASEGCFNTRDLFEQVKEVCIKAFDS